MLELIVLGQVPGTSVQITFKMVLGVAVVLLGIAMLRAADRRELATAELKQAK